MAVARQLLSSARTGEGKDEHNTPPEVLDRVRRIDRIVFDPCPGIDDVVDPINKLKWGDAEGCWLDGGSPWDGLAGGWGSTEQGLIFVNWPYSDSGKWASKTVEQATHKFPIIALTAARPDTRWWRALWNAADAVAFWRGRITFLGQKHPAPFPSALFALNVSQRRFKAAFGDCCEVVCP